MSRCHCQHCRDEREDHVEVGDFIGAVAIVLIFVVLFVFLPLGAW